MRRISNMAALTASDVNVDLAVKEALKRRGKRNELRRRAEEFLKNKESSVAEVKQILLTGNWTIEGYRSFTRREHGKVRKIDWNPSFRDNVVQHALHQTVGERLTRAFIPDTYSGVKGRGPSYGMQRVKQFLRKYPLDSPLYILKLDVRQFYPSILVPVMKSMLEARIKDKVTLRLLFSLLDSHPDGLPIGNYLSQLLANVYLSDIDHHMTEKFGVRHYMRYCDDIVMMSDDKWQLKAALEEMKVKLAEIGLSVKDSAQIYPLGKRGLDFMGYVFRRDGVTLRKRIERGLRRAGRRFNSVPALPSYRPLTAYWGWALPLTRGGQLWDAAVGQSITDCHRRVS